MRNLLLRWLVGKDFAELIEGYKPPKGEHHSVPVGTSTSWTWGRAGLSELEFTANKLLKGAGAGNDPTEIDPVSTASGSYTGDNSQNKAIAHGLGTTPKLVLITARVPTLYTWQYSIVNAQAEIQCIRLNDTTVQKGCNRAVTAPDSTNFYVGDGTNHSDSANDSSYTFDWVAIG